MCIVDDSLIVSFRLSNTVFAACVGKKVVMTEEVEVSESEFSNLTQGGVMKINTYVILKIAHNG